MYAEFRQISLLGMSNSELFLVKDGDEGIEFDDLKLTTLEFQECQATATASSSSSSNDVPDNGDQERQIVLEDQGERKEEEINVIALKETNDDDDEEDDGFKTPTSLDHKIPEMKQCPPAPRKPKSLPSSSNKRKASPTPLAGRNLRLDLSQEVHSLFSRRLLADSDHKVKKPRTKENQ